MELLVAGRCELNACTKAGQTPRWLAHSHVLSQVLGAEFWNVVFPDGSRGFEEFGILFSGVPRRRAI